MNVCANERCSTTILDTWTHCGKCQRAKGRTRKKAKRKGNKVAHGGFDMKHRRAQNGRLKAGMGLSYLKQLDRARWEARQLQLAQAIERWGRAMNQMANPQEAA